MKKMCSSAENAVQEPEEPYEDEQVGDENSLSTTMGEELSWVLQFLDIFEQVQSVCAGKATDMEATATCSARAAAELSDAFSTTTLLCCPSIRSHRGLSRSAPAPSVIAVDFRCAVLSIWPPFSRPSDSQRDRMATRMWTASTRTLTTTANLPTFREARGNGKVGPLWVAFQTLSGAAFALGYTTDMRGLQRDILLRILLFRGSSFHRLFGT